MWGSREALLKELLKKEVERKIYQQSKYLNKRLIRSNRFITYQCQNHL